MIWFTSDLHLGHESLATQKRGYHSLAAMEHLIIQNVNVRVAPTDTLCILGDFSFRCTVEHARELREKIVCRKVHLIAGNHDKDWSRPEVAKTFSLDPPLMRMKTPEGTGPRALPLPAAQLGGHAPRCHHAPRAHPLRHGRAGTGLV
ncbi:MAG: metallophosphoesterase [Olsenella sp.]|nr:metallophosphoesterase [Olsenella sp.]